jgi:hypothetical protein
MNTLRLAVMVLAAVGYTAYRGQVSLPLPAPPVPVVAPHVEIAAAAAALTAEERDALAETYRGLSRAVLANPEADPVFTSTEDIRKGHRAALLCVYRGLLDKKPGGVPGLREAIEGAMAGGIGSESIPLNPTLQRQAADTFAAIATSIDAAK